MSKDAASLSAPCIPSNSRSEHVLVVDDDDMIREVVVRQVVLLGYRVSEAADGPTGLDIIRACADIDLLLTDIFMAGVMSGYDLAEAAEQLRPDLRILFMSGHSEDSTVHGGRLVQKVELLQKPFRQQVLARRLREVLEGGRCP